MGEDGSCFDRRESLHEHAVLCELLFSLQGTPLHLHHVVRSDLEIPVIDYLTTNLNLIEFIKDHVAAIEDVP